MSRWVLVALCAAGAARASLLEDMGFSWQAPGSVAPAARPGVAAAAKHGSVGTPPGPVVLVPGLFGSNIEEQVDEKTGLVCKHASGEWYFLWLDVGEMLPLKIKCFWDHMTMRTLPNGTTTNVEGVNTQVYDYGGVGAVRCAIPKHCNGTKSMYDLLDALEGVGYTAGLDLRAAPYDWRTGPTEWNAPGGDFQKLKTLIEDTVARNGGRRARLISLSLGGPYFHLFLTRYLAGDVANGGCGGAEAAQQWKDAHIENWVALSSLWNGVSLAAHMLTAGYKSSIFPKWLTWLDPADERVVTRTMPGVSFMIPAPYKLANGSVYDPVQVTTGALAGNGRDYRASQMGELLAAAGLDNALALYNRSVEAHSDILEHPGVTTYCWHGTNISTEIGLRFNGTDVTEQPTLVKTMEGDGTVSMDSMQLCKHWPARADHPVAEETFPGIGHIGMVQDTTVLGRILDVVTAGATFPPTPAPGRPYFGNPHLVPCRNDEVNTTAGDGGAFCSTPCTGKHSNQCPSANLYPGVTARPTCDLKAPTALKMCSLSCDEDADCGPSGRCYKIPFGPTTDDDQAAGGDDDDKFTPPPSPVLAPRRLRGNDDPFPPFDDDKFPPTPMPTLSYCTYHWTSNSTM